MSIALVPVPTSLRATELGMNMRYVSNRIIQSQLNSIYRSTLISRFGGGGEENDKQLLDLSAGFGGRHFDSGRGKF